MCAASRQCGSCGGAASERAPGLASLVPTKAQREQRTSSGCRRPCLVLCSSGSSCRHRRPPDQLSLCLYTHMSVDAGWNIAGDRAAIYIVEKGSAREEPEMKLHYSARRVGVGGGDVWRRDVGDRARDENAQFCVLSVEGRGESRASLLQGSPRVRAAVKGERGRGRCASIRGCSRGEPRVRGRERARCSLTVSLPGI